MDSRVRAFIDPCFPKPDLGDIVDDGQVRDTYNDGKGAVRERAEGKGRYDLLPVFATRRLARWYELGAGKYGDRNWEKGIPFSRCIDSCKRHIDKFIMGMHDEDHLAAAVWNLMAIIEYQERRMSIEYDDLPHYMDAMNPAKLLREHVEKELEKESRTPDPCESCIRFHEGAVCTIHGKNLHWPCESYLIEDSSL